MLILDSTNNWAALAVVIFLFILFIITTVRLAKLKKALRYVNCEIRRTDGSELKYWKNERRRLIIAFLFFKPIR